MNERRKLPDARQLGTVRDYRDLHALLRARADELGITRESTDEECSFAPRYSTKILGPTPIKSVGMNSLGPLLSLFGLALIVVEDPDAMQRYKAQREGARSRRQRGSVRRNR